jgi:hypothetical protein
MIPQLQAATANIEQASAALDELIFALNARLVACRKIHARRRERERQERAPVGAGTPNLWWVGGVIPLDILFPGRTPHQVEEGFG